MLGDYLLSAQLRRLFKRHIFFRPRRFYHSHFILLGKPFRPLYGVSHAVDETDVDIHSAVEFYFYGFVRYEFGLSGHNRFAVACLRQLVGSALTGVLVFDIGQNQTFHDFGHEGGFPRANRTHHADINVAVGAGCDIAVNVELLH